MRRPQQIGLMGPLRPSIYSRWSGSRPTRPLVRPPPTGLVGPSDDPLAPMVRGQEVAWLQPFPDAKLDPADLVASRGSLRLAVVAAMQLLPARQRAVLILRDVLDWSASEAAEALDTTTASVNSALQRARAKLGQVSLVEEQVDEPTDRE